MAYFWSNKYYFNFSSFVSKSRALNLNSNINLLLILQRKFWCWHFDVGSRMYRVLSGILDGRFWLLYLKLCRYPLFTISHFTYPYQDNYKSIFNTRIENCCHHNTIVIIVIHSWFLSIKLITLYNLQCYSGIFRK